MTLGYVLMLMGGGSNDHILIKMFIVTLCNMASRISAMRASKDFTNDNEDKVKQLQTSAPGSSW